METMIMDPKLTLLLFAAMVDRFGGKITITQADIDRVAFNHLEEDMTDGVLTVRLVERIAAKGRMT